MEVVVILVTTRLLGVVGAERSPLPPAAELVDPLKSRPAVNAKIDIPMIRRERCRVVMGLLLLPSPVQIVSLRVQGLHPHQRTQRSDTHAWMKILERTREREVKIIRFSGQ
jgi:hypothetical protein